MSSTALDFENLCTEARKAVRHKEYEKAIELFEKALAIDEKPEVHEGLAAACYLSDQFDAAIRHYERVMALRPNDSNPLVNIGAVYNRLGEHKKAVDVLSKAVRKSKRCPEAYYNLGMAYRNLNQLSMAVSAYREVLRLEPQMKEAHTNLANVYLEMKNFSQATSHYRKALEIDPAFERARKGLLKVDESKKKTNDAFGPFGRLVKTPPTQDLSTKRRRLSELERAADRKAVADIASEAVQYARSLNDQLATDLIPTLAKISRALLENPDAASIHSEGLHLQFRGAMNRAVTLRGNLKASIEKLREHENSLEGRAE